eukprot:c16282_g1_i2.p1 GENE.c16282_g1_i2~~c16282_g1_i2.p1  ORF type:complete len:322 (+),score=133.56 c16282_g1_i2:30-968(+)
MRRTLTFSKKTEQFLTLRLCSQTSVASTKPLSPKKYVKPAPVVNPHIKIHPDIPHRYQKVMLKTPIHPLDQKAAESGFQNPWKIYCAAAIERLPLVTPDENPVELEYLLAREELDQKFLYPYPPELEPKFESTENQSKGKPKEGTLAAFRPASRLTIADRQGNVKTTNRKLATRIYLVVQGSDGVWSFPTVELNATIGLRKCLEVEVQKTIGGDKNDMFWVGNGPFAYHKFEFSDAQKKAYNAFGGKVFYFSCQYVGGGNTLNIDLTKYSDFAWLSRAELPSRLSSDVCETLIPILPNWHQETVEEDGGVPY